MPSFTGRNPPGRIRDTVTLDLQTNELEYRQVVDAAGFVGDTRVVLGGDQGVRMDLRNRTMNTLGAAAQASFRAGIDVRLPVLLLRAARQRSPRYAGTRMFEGRLHDLVACMSTAGESVMLLVDGTTRLLSRYEVPRDDPLLGQTLEQRTYNGSRQVGGLTVPAGYTIAVAGNVSPRATLNVQRDVDVPRSTFAISTDGFFRITPAATPAERMIDLEAV